MLECQVLIPAAEKGHLPQVDLVLKGVVEVVRVVLRGTDPGFGVACEIKNYTIVAKK